MGLVECCDSAVDRPSAMDRLFCFWIFGRPYTIGRAFGTMCRLSSRLSSVTFCIVAKRYVLAKNCLKE